MSAAGDALTPPPPAWERACAGQSLVRRLQYYPRVASTQALGRQAAREDGPGTLIIAGEQTAGRGRRGRNWFSPAEQGLWMSLTLAPQRPEAEWPFVTSLAGLALRAAVARRAGIACGLKWPNDLLCRGRKLAGILAERVQGAPLVLGIGVNLEQREADFPPALRSRATSLRIECAHRCGAAPPGDVPGAPALLATLLPALAERLARFAADGAAALLPELTEASLLIGRCVRIGAPGGGGDETATTDAAPDAAGRVIGFDGLGALLLDAAENGRIERVTGGEIWAVDPPLNE